MSSPTISTDQNAGDLIQALADADAEQVQGVLAEESAKDQPRVTVIRAAQARLEELEPISEADGEVLTDGIPDGAWAQLLDGDGEPLLVDGNPVAGTIIP